MEGKHWAVTGRYSHGIHVVDTLHIRSFPHYFITTAAAYDKTNPQPPFSFSKSILLVQWQLSADPQKGNRIIRSH